jgi:hypothetical protein
MNGIAVGTVFAKNYLAMGRVLAESFRQRHPDVPFFALLSDEPDGCLAAAEPFRLLRLEDVRSPEIDPLRFAHSRQGLATTVKPLLLRHLLDCGFQTAMFLDPDILILNDLNRVFDTARSHAVTLTPHLLSPAKAGAGAGRELNILKSGVYNGGLLCVSESASARRFLNWWLDRVGESCRHAVAEGVYFDQRWLDLAPVFFEDVFIYRDPGCNVAYWNLPERSLRFTPDGSVSVDGVPCCFFHFSGFDPDLPNVVTRHFPNLTFDGFGDVARLFQQYATLLIAAGYHQTKSLPYAYDSQSS